jgi:hypothetical protein
MKTSNLVKLLLVAMLLGAGSARADFFFQATLTNTQETPVTPPFQGTAGFATFVLNTARTQLTYFLDTTGLDFRAINPATGISTGGPIGGDPDPNDNAIRIHIHAAPLGVAGGIVFGQVDLPTNAGPCPCPPATDTVNDEDDLQVDIANGIIRGVWDATEGANANPANFLTAQLGNLFSNNLYINVHSNDFPGGEIRGQIVFQAMEPGSLALVAFALGGIYFVRRKLISAETRV